MIKEATRQDIPVLIEMMRCYANEAPIEVLRNVQDEIYVGNLLFSIIVGRGFVLIDENNNGFLAAIVTNNVWCPKVLELKELAWWVKPEQREGSLGGRLWMEFNLRADKMLAKNRVHIVTTSSMSISPEINYEKRGFKFLEKTFYKCQHP